MLKRWRAWRVARVKRGFEHAVETAAAFKILGDEAESAGQAMAAMAALHRQIKALYAAQRRLEKLRAFGLEPVLQQTTQGLRLKTFRPRLRLVALTSGRGPLSTLKKRTSP